MGQSITQADSERERQAPEQQAQHGGEGKAPHRAEAFVAMRRNEERKASRNQTSDKQVAVQEGPRRQKDTRAVAENNQIPEGRHQQESPTEPRSSTTINRREGAGTGGRAAKGKSKQPPEQEEQRERGTKEGATRRKHNQTTNRPNKKNTKERTDAL